MFRSIQSFIIAIFVTLGLIVGMYALIKMDEPDLSASDDVVLPDINYNPKNEEVDVITPKPIRPPEVEAQPDLPDIKVIPDQIDINSDFTLGAVKVGINRDLKGFNQNDGE